ncbi:FAD-dependent oxidoreductase [Streptomyces sp. NPDC026294]|uniref:FAD-dependent oxidoreductase n=1 Tax=Streptomyces sp. NPDC026294 TaxID=3155362 RepID=UPI00340C9111
MRGETFRPEGDGYDGHDRYDEERAGFQRAARHRPAIIVGARCPGGVRLAVEFAAVHGLPVTVKATGHGPAVLADGGVLVTTCRMDGVRIDAATATTHPEAGARWEQVVPEASRNGLAPLNGSAPHVAAVPYTLGGGLRLLSSAYGYAADHVRAMDVDTADTRLRHVTPDSDPDLFWALLGGPRQLRHRRRAGDRPAAGRADLRRRSRVEEHRNENRRQALVGPWWAADGPSVAGPA